MCVIKIAGAGIVSTFIVATWAAPAFAQDPTFTISPATATPGQTITLNADCVAPNRINDYTGTGPLADLIVPEDQASEEFDYDLPADTAPGTYTASLGCEIASGGGETLEATLVVTAIPPSPSPAPSTSPKPTPSGAPKTGGGGSGSGTNVLMGIGALTAAAGIGTVLFLRRRDS